jgi:catechol 2,3-dioxygenase-like lactoylglutathione lyase family enzyme
MIRAIKFVSIPVRDQERALSFYTEKLGFQILTDQPLDAKQRWIERESRAARPRWFCSRLPAMKIESAPFRT